VFVAASLPILIEISVDKLYPSSYSFIEKTKIEIAAQAVFVTIAVPMLFWRKTLITAVRGWASYGIVAFIVSVFYLLCVWLYSAYVDLLFPLLEHPNILLLGFAVAEAPVALLLILRRRHQNATTSG